MLRFLIRRTLGGIVIVILISAVTYGLFWAIPHDPALLSCGKNCTADNIKLIHKNLGIDEPIYMQYWHYMVGIFAGRDLPLGRCGVPCLGYSFAQSAPVWDIIHSSIGVTISLAVGGAAVFLTVGVGTGLLAAAKRGTMIDKSASSASLVLNSFQIYFIGPLAVALIVYNLHWLNNPKYNNFTDNPAQWFVGLIIPWCVLSIIFVANYTRMVRSLMVEQLQEEHVRMARAKGMSRPTVFFRYAWRGALAMVVTQLGMDFSSLLGGAIITETTFSLPGLGLLAVQSSINADLPMIMGLMLFSAVVIIALNVVVDCIYAAIDPRVRLS